MEPKEPVMFNFDGQSIPMEKFKTYAKSARFSDTCIPIIICHIRPLEQFLAAWVNGHAPLDYTWGMSDLLLVSESDMNDAILKAYKTLVSFYLPDRTYTEAHFDSLLPDIATVYDTVNHQMLLDGVMEFYAKRKSDFIVELSKSIGIDSELVRSKTENTIMNIIGKRSSVDKEFSGIKE